MILSAIKAKLGEAPYDFLRTDPCLGGNLLLLTVSGSVAYGTDNENSDLDVRGVAVETAQNLLGLSSFEQMEDGQTDTVIYGLKKFINLCLQCNPNMVELLGTAEDHCLVITEEGRLLRDNAGLFLSRRAIHSFGNYASAQLRRLQNALAHDQAGDDEAEEHILHRVENQLAHLKKNFPALTGGELEVYLDKSSKPGVQTEIFMDIRLKRFPLRDFKTVYSDMSTVVRDYSALNHRNNKKDEPHLFKHAMHLLRLLATGTDVLDGKGVVTYRGAERELFQAIRRGELSFKEIFRLVDEFEARFKRAAADTRLPDEPDTGKVEALMMEIYRRRLKI